MTVWGVTRADVRRLAVATVLAACAELAGLLLMATAAWLLLRAAEQPPIAALTVAIIAVRALALLRGGLRYAERLAGHEVVLRYLGALRGRVYETLTARRSSRFSGGDLLSRLVSDVDAAQDAVLRCLLPALVALVVGMAAVTGALLFSAPAALALVAGLVLAGVLLPVLSARSARRAADADAPALAALADSAIDLARGAVELRAFGAADRAVAAARTVASGLSARERRRAGSPLPGAGAAIQVLTTLAVCVTAGGLGLPAIAALGLGTMAVFETVLPLATAARRWAEVREPLRRLHQLLSEPAPRDGSCPVPAANVHLRLRGAGLRYPGRPAPALTGVDLDLPQGRLVALVGPSGSGKSTLLAALAGQVETTAGAVTLNGRALGAYPAERLPVSGALADAHVFRATVRENLLLAKPSASDDELLAACRAAGSEAELDRLPGTDGAAMSGGQRQRLLLARALLSDAPVLLLDEPVEGLDPAHADAVLRSVLTAAAGRTVVLATHQPAPLPGFDEILVLDEGEVVERGTHAELVARAGYYAEHYLPSPGRAHMP
ncbi:thiol reductant ABC exporter subunit CydC [Amycolatopsis minnesotensis]|uniref:Thiol reductant ABC exporter subunit CydC n=1 Tax=Amycolatopsis minnesotensis TaxID=337894 RepID=A0ABN2SJ29_9PSEU